MTFSHHQRTAHRTIIVGVAASATVALIAGCSSPSAAPEAGGDAVMPSSSISEALGALPERSVAELSAPRLAKGLVPPTNRWFSGLVFGEQPQPVFPLPLSFGLTDDGFGFGVPTVTTTPNTITGGYLPAITVGSAADATRVSAFDDASVTVDLLTGDESLGSVVIAEGSPLVSFTAEADTELTLNVPFAEAGDGVWSATAGEAEYGLVTTGDVSEGSLTLEAGQTAVWIAVPEGGNLATLATHAAPLESVQLKYATAAETATSTLDYRSAGSTLIATMPHQRDTLSSPTTCDLGSYPSVYGTLELCAGSKLSWTTPIIESSSSLDLSGLDDTQRETLRDQVAADIAAAPELPADSYFGGKALYRLANLLDLAVQLDDTTSAATAQKQLNAALREWTEPTGCDSRDTRCFVYDAKTRGVVGLEASFGAGEFNDHHFHYGYFLYAASIAATHDEGVLADIQPVIDLLAADLATSGESTDFPERRVFDAYAGHSWASGTSPFADGNNQESSSEAVTAWNGLALWAGVTSNAPLEREADWMLSAEAASANAYWTDFDTTDPVYDGYDHGVTSINWGGKRDYSTWFSAEPNAKLAILALPMSPVAGYLGADPARIESNLAEAAPNGYDVTFGDYLLMYSALADPTAALAEAESLPDARIDDGNSRAYMLAWIMTR